MGPLETVLFVIDDIARGILGDCVDEYEIDDISAIYLSTRDIDTTYFITGKKELLLAGNNNYPKLYSCIPPYSDIPIKVDTNVIQNRDSSRAVA